MIYRGLKSVGVIEGQADIETNRRTDVQTVPRQYPWALESSARILFVQDKCMINTNICRPWEGIWGTCFISPLKNNGRDKYIFTLPRKHQHLKLWTNILYRRGNLLYSHPRGFERHGEIAVSFGLNESWMWTLSQNEIKQRVQEIGSELQAYWMVKYALK